ncbi:hypothetical protein LAG90_18310 [Marinilongibacter aquaticus]|uniref:hypothetical protein n=1 Tax=Marinilongibacter aquaticus TaxID=2975157 RepID=UPI0021BD88BC|nr:hypothetical protein [Marinilongibacter aquaticus]UBM58757.1 hypothetical protein LAG90_18310 [Marinilongibacter aquaticus]
MTQKLTVNTSPSVRVAADPTIGKVYPNPTYVGFENTIEFDLEYPANVKLELVDESGKIVKELANGMHDAGKYRYPFSLGGKSFKMFDQFYYRLTVGDRAETRRIILE